MVRRTVSSCEIRDGPRIVPRTYLKRWLLIYVYSVTCTLENFVKGRGSRLTICTKTGVSVVQFENRKILISLKIFNTISKISQKDRGVQQKGTKINNRTQNTRTKDVSLRSKIHYSIWCVANTNPGLRVHVGILRSLCCHS